MIELLFAVLVLGVVAYVIYNIPMPEPFKVVAVAILVIILLVLLFRAFGYNFVTL